MTARAETEGQLGPAGAGGRAVDDRRWLALLVLCLGDLMIVLDVTIVGVALPSIRADLGFSEESLAWVVNAYLITFGGFLLLGGRLGDLLGHQTPQAAAGPDEAVGEPAPCSPFSAGKPCGSALDAA
jgi:hypothetical protein